VKLERPVREHSRVRRLVVPLVLTVTVVGAAIAVVSSSAGCDDDASPSIDAGRDAAPDTPII
jgi:hypothetical protein